MDDSRSSSSSSPSSDPSSSSSSSSSELIPAAQMAASFASAPECEPYILPLFPEEDAAAMGHNVTWICKALGSTDMALSWRLPSDGNDSNGSGSVVGDGECLERACVSRGSSLTVRFLHPGDAGRYECVARNKYGQDQRQVLLAVKVRNGTKRIGGKNFVLSEEQKRA